MDAIEMLFIYTILIILRLPSTFGEQKVPFPEKHKTLVINANLPAPIISGCAKNGERVGFFKPLRMVCMVQGFLNVFHIDAIMAFLKHAFSVFNDENLRRLVMNMKIFCYFIGYGAIFQQIQVIEGNILRGIPAIQPHLSHRADRAPGAVLENDNRMLPAFFFYLVQLLLVRQLNPIHTAKVRRECFYSSPFKITLT